MPTQQLTTFTEHLVIDSAPGHGGDPLANKVCIIEFDSYDANGGKRNHPLLYEHMGRAAMPVRGVVGTAWSARELDIVCDFTPSTADKPGALCDRWAIDLMNLWHRSRIRIPRDFGFWVAFDPAYYGWALPSAEEMARAALRGRHQCEKHGICYCACLGVEHPRDAWRQLGAISAAT